MTIGHRGMRALVKENHEGVCVIEVGPHRMETGKKFPASCREALTYLLENAGEMRGTYDRN